jgi:non-ribosomal peptide synthetase-like protein
LSTTYSPGESTGLGADLHLPELAASGLAVFRAAAAPPERTLVDVFERTVAGCPDAPALDDGRDAFDYRALAAEAGSLAARLRGAGIGAGDRVGVRVPSGTADLYVAILGVLAAGAAYVPVDTDDPDERVQLVWSEAGVCAVLGAGLTLTTRPGVVPGGVTRRPRPDDDAWIIFTSGSTGKPKGVAISHRSAAAFVDAEAALFVREWPLGPGDRVLAGLSVAFDASCEEMWLAWRHGGCLIPAPRALVRAGADLGSWLARRRVTVVSTVPTLAALWPLETVAHVRLLILGGEACPGELAARLCDGTREVWNTYGPTEATVVACAAPLSARGPVRIGLPLDGWQLAVLDPGGQPVAWGETGELVIGGVGLGRYLDPALDRRKYAPVPSLGWERGYRSGDLVRADPAGLLFAGRADDQVKLGGRRIELGEIDAALRALPGVCAAAAAVKMTAGGAQVLAGYVVPEQGATIEPARARQVLARQLPAALVPRIVVLDSLPTRTSGKVDRAALPWPPPDWPGPGRPVGPAKGMAGTAGTLATRWEELLGVTVDDEHADFFALGGTSLAAAQLVTTLRRTHPGVSVADIYQHPVLRQLADRLDNLTSPRRSPRVVRPAPHGSGLARMLVLLLTATVTGIRYLIVVGVVADVFRLGRVGWMPYLPVPELVAGWLVLMSVPGRVVLTAIGVRVLRGRIKPGEYRRGGLVHLRLWACGAVAATFAMGSISGTHWAARYARLLGCRVGQDVALHADPPVTGMAAFGDRCAVEKEVDLSGVWLDGDVLHVGAVAIRSGARVGTRTTLMPGTVIGDNAEVEPGSSVNGYVPAAQRWAGSPARPAGVAGATWPPPCAVRSRRWRIAYTASVLFLSVLPLLAAAPSLLVVALLVGNTHSLRAATLLAVASSPMTVTLGLVTYGLITATLVRLLAQLLPPGLHRADGRAGWAAWLAENLVGMARTGLFPIYASLLTPVWLRLLGARVGRRVEASTVLALPHLIGLADGSFLADDARLAAYELRGGWLRLGCARVGERAFVGNSGMVGPGRDVPDGGLIGVLSAAPASAAAGSSWLGQPPMLLPRKPDAADPARTFDPPGRLVLARACVEVCRLIPVIASGALGVGVFSVLGGLLTRFGLALTAAVSGLVLLAAGVLACAITTAAKWILVGRCRAAEHPLWSSFVWRNELADTFVEELAVPWLAGSATGTPLLNVWLRSLGARIGRGAWIETYWLPEPDLIEIGPDATIGRGVVVQTHLFHDRIMRLGPVRIGAGATLGPHTIVLPGSLVAQGATIGPQSLVMRGESVPAHSRWTGNPISAWQDTAGRAPRRRHRRGGRPSYRRGDGRLLVMTTRRPGGRHRY